MAFAPVQRAQAAINSGAFDRPADDSAYLLGLTNGCATDQAKKPTAPPEPGSHENLPQI